MEIAKECEEYATIAVESKQTLQQMLDNSAYFDSLEILAYAKIANLRF